MSDATAVSEVLLCFAHALDAHDWATCETLLLPEITTDYGDLRGEPAQRVSAAAYVAKRQLALAPLRTQHLSTNHMVTMQGDAATCVSQGVIYRFSGAGPAEYFHTHCTYWHTLVRTAAGWKISSITQRVVQNLGNPALHAGAAVPAS